MDAKEIDRLLAQLRRFRMDHQHVEAKRVRTELPADVWKTLSAFANSQGGLLLLGVDEAEGFTVTGVESPDRIATALQALATQSMEPPLRPTIEMVEHPNGIVIVARVAPVPRDQRPCHYRQLGPIRGSCIRVGDGDHHLSETEVTELLAAQRREDQSARPVAPEARLGPALVSQFCDNIRAMSAQRYGDTADGGILCDWGAMTADGASTLAGLLTLGENPQGTTPAARLTYRLLPDSAAPAGARFSGDHFEGTIGEILDDTLDRLHKDLDTYQVEDGGALVDETDVPREALREILSNALIHRSLTTGAESRSVLVEVSESAVRIVSPGGLHVTVDPERLGLEAFPGVRNLALVRICEKLTTPSGRRILESQGSGVRAADRACRRRGTAPAVFADHPDRLEVILLRGRLPENKARSMLQEAALDETSASIRLLAWATRFDELREEVDPVRSHAAELDVYMAARLCTPEAIEDAATQLTQLESGGLLIRVGGVTHTSWILGTTVSDAGIAEPPGPAVKREDRIPDLLAALVAAGGEASSEKIGAHLNLKSSKSVMKWVNRAIKKSLVEPTTESPYDPGRAYRITTTGRAVLERSGAREKRKG